LAAVTLVIAPLILTSLLVLSFGGLGLEVNAQAEHTYYGFVPSEVWVIEAAPGGQAGHDIVKWQVRPGTAMTQASIVVVGNHDGTRVSAYALPGKELLGEFTVNKLEERSLRVANASFFKVVSERPVTVVFMGGVDYERKQAFMTAFFPSIQGGYVGREFVFLAVVSPNMPWTHQPYRVYALEDSELKLWDANGSKVREFKLSANQVEELPLSPWAVYRLESTGSVLLHTWVMGSIFYPAVTGGFVGKLFYGSSGVTDWWPRVMPPAFVMTGLQDAKLNVVDLEFKRKYDDATLAATSNVTMQVKAAYMAVESDTPIMLLLHNTGVTYTGLAAGQTAYVQVPTKGPTDGEAYIFAYKETMVTMDDVTVKLSADEAMSLPGGFHKLSTTENMLIEVVDWPSQQWPGSIAGQTKIPEIWRLDGFGTVIPSVQSLSVRYEGLKLKPPLEQGPPWTYILAGVAAVVVLILILLIAKRRETS